MERPLVSHVSIAVSDLEKGIALMETVTGTTPKFVREVPQQKVRVAVFSSGPADKHGGGSIELVSPTAADSPVGKFIARKGEGLHHICLYVDNLEDKLEELKSAGVRLIDEQPRIGAEGGKIAFVHPSSCNGVLLELEERPR